MTTVNSGRAPDVQRNTSKKQLLSCGVGSLYNDVVNKVMFSFALIYYMKVAVLSSRQAGLVLIAGQFGNFAGNFLFGYCCDKVNIPFLSAGIGRRKSWHLFGTIFTAVFFVLAFSRCFICIQSSSSWIKCVYFASAYGLSCFFYGAVETSHISIIPEIAVNHNDTVILNALRTGFAYFGGIMAYVVVWIVLGQSSEYNLSSDNWIDFTKITCISTAIGVVSVSVFHIGTKERKKTNHKTRAYSLSLFRTAGSYSVALAFTQGIQQLKDQKEGAYRDILRSVNQFDNADSTPSSGQTGYEEHGDPEKKKIRQDIDKTLDSSKQGGNQQKQKKGLKEWLRDAKLYEVTFIFTCALTLENTTYAYLALYLMDYLRFEKEASAYCSLIFLCSGLCGSAISKRLSKTIGKRWTLSIAAAVSVAAAAWLYFVTPSTKNTVYAPVVLIGCGVSALMVMALSFLTDVMWGQKESSGFIFSFASCAEKVFCGAFLFTIQVFYPNASSGPECASYVHWTYPLALGTLPLAVFLFAINCRQSIATCCSRSQDPGQPARPRKPTFLEVAWNARSRYHTV